MQTEFFPVLNLSLRSVVNNEVRLLVEVSLALRTDEHICNKVSLPCNLHDETDLHTCILVCSAETVNNEKTLV